MRTFRITGMSFALALLAGCGDRTPMSVDTNPLFSETVLFSGEVTALQWQKRARELVSAGLFNPMAGGRLYAALSVAQIEPSDARATV